MENPFDPKNAPKGGAALFRWMLARNKWEAENPSPEDIARREEAFKKLKEKNAERTTTVSTPQI
jgi:hypothetical protein